MWNFFESMLKLRRAGVVFVLVNEETSNTKLYFRHGNSRFDSTNTILIKGKLYIYMNITKKSTHSFNSGCYNTTDWDVSGPPSTQVLPRAGEWYQVTSTVRRGKMI